MRQVQLTAWTDKEGRPPVGEPASDDLVWRSVGFISPSAMITVATNTIPITSIRVTLIISKLPSQPSPYASR